MGEDPDVDSAALSSPTAELPDPRQAMGRRIQFVVRWMHLPSLNLRRRYAEVQKRFWSERGTNRYVARIPTVSNRDTPDAWLIVPSVERAPLAAKEDFEPA